MLSLNARHHYDHGRGLALALPLKGSDIKRKMAAAEDDEDLVRSSCRELPGQRYRDGGLTDLLFLLALAAGGDVNARARRTRTAAQ
jgi:hypothetical protein